MNRILAIDLGEFKSVTCQGGEKGGDSIYLKHVESTPFSPHGGSGLQSCSGSKLIVPSAKPCL